MMNDTKKRNLLLACILVSIIVVLFGVIVWRNAYGRRERVRVFLIKFAPHLSKPELWEIEEYKEKRTTQWRVRRFEASGVIKRKQPLYAMGTLFEPRVGEPLAITIYRFKTLKEMASGVSFEVAFDSDSDSAQRTTTSIEIPKFYTAQDLKDLCGSGIVVTDDEILPESLQQSKDIEKFAVQLDLQLILLEKELIRLEQFFVGGFSSYSGDAKLRQIEQKKKEMNDRLALLTVSKIICRDNPALKDYNPKILRCLIKYQSLLARIGELEKITRDSIQRRTPLESNTAASQGSPRPDERITPAPSANSGAAAERAPILLRPEAQPEKLLPAMMPPADARTTAWARIHRPELFDKYTACLAECSKKQNSFRMKADAILKYNAVYRQLVDEKRSYDANPVKGGDLEPEMLEFAEAECPEYHRAYVKARRSIRNRRILYNKARKDGAPQGRIDQLQADINGAIVSFNDARQHIINRYNKKKK